MDDSMYRILLRVSALTLALVLLFVSGIFSPITRELSSGTGTYLASVVDTVPLQPDVSKKIQNENVIGINKQQSTHTASDVPAFILSVILYIVLVLIISNYVLDYTRGRQKSLQ